MKSKTLFTVMAIVLGLVGVMWLFAPDQLFPNFEITSNGDLTFMAHRYSAYIIGWAVTFWMVRDLPESKARRAVMMGGFIAIAFTAFWGVWAALNLSSKAWMVGGSEILFALWFAYFLFMKKES